MSSSQVNTNSLTASVENAVYSPEYCPGSPEYRPNTPSGEDTIIPGENGVPELTLPPSLNLSKVDEITDQFAEMYVSEEPNAPKESEEGKDPNYLYYTKYWCTTQERFVGFVVGQNRKNIKRVVSNFKRNSHGVKCRIDLYNGKFKIVLKIRKGLYDVQLAQDYTNM